MALDLVSAARTSKYWNIAPTPLLYRSLTLDFESSKSVLTSRLLQSLLTTDKERPAYRHYVRNLKITMPSTAGDSASSQTRGLNGSRQARTIAPNAQFVHIRGSNCPQIWLRIPLTQLQMGSSRANAGRSA